jgi:serine/threonine protein kinase
MPLRDPQYKGFNDLMKRRIEPSFRALVTAGYQLADSFLQLHAQGLCYRDISFGNVFFDPQTGDILICDNDNVAINGEQFSAILGTPRFMAPEIIYAQAQPSAQTDLYSLSVLLFYLLMIHHPLEGKKELQIKCLDAPAMNKLYGSEAIFIFDPTNNSNKPEPGYHDNALIFWEIYTQFLRDLFISAFTEGIKDPQNGRVRESQWREAMVRLRDSIIYCSNCGEQNFLDSDHLKKISEENITCWSCKHQVQPPLRIRFNKNIVMLNYDTQLFVHHVNPQKIFDFSEPIAQVTQHPTNVNIWGLQNLSNLKWVSTSATGEIHDIEPRRSVKLAVGTKINFGQEEGEIF